MIRAIAIDDEPPALEIIEAFCASLPEIKLEKCFFKPNEALNYIAKFPVDLVFLDIQMSSITGIELCKKLSPNVMVIFTTAYQNYAVEGFNLNAIDYIVKPFSQERFQKAVEKAQEYYQYKLASERNESYLFIRADFQLHKIKFADITYIESLADYIKIYIHQSKPIVTRMTMKFILNKLPEKDFVRISRYFIISIMKIDRITQKSVSIDGKQLEIGNKYAKEFLQKLKN